MKRKTAKNFYTAMGYVIFFFTIAVMVTIALTVYERVRGMEGRGSVSGVMLGVILSLSAVCTLIDVIRRKIMVERPVRKILSATEKIASGDFSVRLETEHSYERYDEYDLIMENLNMVAEELGKSELLKTDFISNISHELKTPLAIIKSYTELIAKSGVTEEERVKYSEIIISASRRLSSLVSNILKLNKLENQGITELSDVRVGALLSECIIAYEELLEKKSIELSADIDEFSLKTSESHIEIVFNNLFSNAVKFTEPGGKISVSLKRKGNDAYLKVSDSGCGISKEAGTRIFEKFYQADTSRSGEGNGLGLALVKKVIDVLGGEIYVESEIGRGSTFTVVFKSCSE